MAKTIDQSVQKWQRGISGGGAYYKAGVQGAKSWVEGSLAASDRRNAGLQAAIANGTIDGGIRRATDAKWRDAAMNKGAANWVNNTPNAAPAYRAGLQRAMGYQDQARAATANLPRTTIQDRAQYAAAWVTAVHEAAQRDKANG